MRKLLSALAVQLSLLSFPLSRVWAQDAASFKDLETVFGNAIKVLVELVGVALFVMLIIGGFKYMFAGGDQKKLESARGTLTNAIFGLVIIAVSYLILKTIDVALLGGHGIITKFEIPIGN